MSFPKLFEILVATLVLALSGIEGVAAAGRHIVVESYTGKRPADADALLGPVYAELIASGFLARGTLASEIRLRISRETADLTAAQIAEAQRAVDRSYEQFVDGEYADALIEGQKALALYARATGQLTRENTLRDLQFKALLVTARSLEVLGRGEEAFATMAEAIRTFPDRHVSSAEFAPSVNSLFRRVKEEFDRQGLGSLEIEVDDPSLAIFINEHFVGVGAVRVDNLYQGKYRVCATKGGAQHGRVQEINVSTASVSRLLIQWRFQDHLRTTDDYVGLSFSTISSLTTEVDVASQLARELDADAIVILGVRTLEGRRQIAASAVSIDSQSRIFATIQAEPVKPSSQTLARLGALLAGRKDVDTRDIAISRSMGDGERPRAASTDKPGQHDLLGWAIVGAAAVSASTATGFWLSADVLRRRANTEEVQSISHDLRRRADERVTIGSAFGVAAAAILIGGIVKLHFIGQSNAGGATQVHLVAGTDWIGVRGAF